MFQVPKEDIENYQHSFNFFDQEKLETVNCGICGPNYCELVIQPLNYDIGGIIFRTFNEPDFGGIIFGNPSDDSIYLELNRSSQYFIDFFRFNESYSTLSFRRLKAKMSSGRSLASTRIREINSYIIHPFSIRIHNLGKESKTDAFEYSRSLAESCLFELAYLKRFSFKLLEEWPDKKKETKKDPRSFIIREESNFLPIPKTRFNNDIIKFYQLGNSNDAPILQFLAYYQILEYFFLKVSDEALHKKLFQRLNDPKFSFNEQNLDHLVKDVLEYDSKNDETDMLKKVLTKYVKPIELIEFLKGYEDYLDEKYYSKQRNRFGQNLQVNFEETHVISNVATIVKVVRNALVHSSDRFERNERVIPFTKSTDIVIKEIPLIKFLAEKVIIGSASIL